jgi:NitT/TauT family transport system substrate-binding protein
MGGYAVRLWAGWLVALALGMGTLGGAGSPAAGQARQKVTFVTDFGFNGRHAYYFVALDRGYYREAGLDVQIVRGGGSEDAIKQVGAGRALLGFADAATLVLARGNDRVPVKLVAIVYARPPQAIYALKESGIKTPKDLEGKTVANPPGGSIVALFPLYAKFAGINPGRVKWIVADANALPALLVSRQVDAIGQFIVGEALIRKRASPKELVRLAYGDVGLDYYGNGIIATDDTLRQRPDLVRAFVRATIRGMEDAFRDPSAAGRILNKYHPEIDPDIGQGETEAVRELAVTKTAQQHGLGYIDRLRVWKTIQVVSSAFNLRTPVSVEDAYAPGFAGRP